MLDWTYSHFRVMMRLIAPHALLYTEMLTIAAILHQEEKLLAYHPCEAPLALQIGGSDPDELAKCVLLAAKRGYVEVNLNLGCPSDRVKSGHFGACLMAEPDRVVACIRAMKAVTDLPITAKIRIGIDAQDSFSFFSYFF